MSKTIHKYHLLYIILILFVAHTNKAHSTSVLPQESANSFCRLNMVYNDRVCPVQTYAYDFVKKLYGKRSFNGYSAEQVLTGFMFWYDEWKKEKIIKVKDDLVRDRLNLEKYCSIEELFNRGGNSGYALGPFMMEYYNGLTDKFHEGVSKLDDKIGLVMDLRKYAPLKIFPYTKDGTTIWYSPVDNYPTSMDEGRKQYMQEILPLIGTAAQKGNISELSEAIEKLKKYQYTFGGKSIPSSFRLKAEYIYNSFPFATVLFMVNLTMGFLCLFYLLWRMTRTVKDSSPDSFIMNVRGAKVSRAFLIQAVILFMSLLVLTFCLSLRWIIRGTIPMSNGYETMLVMAWMIMLVSLLLFRRFPIILTFGFLLSGFFLLVSHISQMDPQITHLMPVLSSPLLTIHVSIIMMAYALLSLTFICGLTGLIICLFRGKRAPGIDDQLTSLQRLSQLFLYPSLTTLGLGIFIGAIWANISWGTYWSWDPKETWALITLMVYAVAVHDNSIPALRRPFVYHMFMTLAFLTILMTYFGVNYYLGGMHSYA